MNYWFHSGDEFTTQAGFDNKDNTVKVLACEENKRIAVISNTEGEYTYRPSPGPLLAVEWYGCAWSRIYIRRFI